MKLVRRSARTRIAAASEPLEPRRLLTAGDLDSTFGLGGIVVSDFPAPAYDRAGAIVRQPDGKYIVAGSVSGDYFGDNAAIAIARYNLDGSLDGGFGVGGRAVVPVGRWARADAVALAPDGKIVAAGASSPTGGSGGLDQTFAVVRLNNDGSLDTSFSDDGRQTVPFAEGGAEARGVALQPDGRIVLAGSATGRSAGYFTVAALARLNPDGSLDGSFDGDGKASPVAALRGASGVTIDTAGRIVAAVDDAGFAAARFLAYGSLDPTFNGTGIVHATFGGRGAGASAIALAPNGTVVVVGTTAFGTAGDPPTQTDVAVARFSDNGALDSTFSGDGMATVGSGDRNDEGRALAVGADGSVTVAGRSSAPGASGYGPYAVFRLTGAGLPDASFDGDGTVAGAAVEAEGDGVVLDPDGSAVVAGYTRKGYKDLDFLLARYTRSGTLAPSLGGTGEVATNFTAESLDRATAVVVQPDGKVVVGATSPLLGDRYFDFQLTRYNVDGSLDSSFGTGGTVLTDVAANYDRLGDLAVQSDGKIIAVGSAYDPASRRALPHVVRYNADGALDPTFGQGGHVAWAFRTSDAWESLTGVVVQADGRIVVTGSDGADFATARLKPDGSFDTTFSGDGKVITHMNGPSAAYPGWGRAHDVAVDAGGAITVAGPTGFDFFPTGTVGVARYDAAGNLDPTFGDGGKAQYAFSGGSDGEPVRLAAAPDGSTFVGATWWERGETTFWADKDFGVFRLDRDGNIDPFWGPAEDGGIARIDFTGGDDVLGDLLLDGSKVIAVGTAAAGPDSFDTGFGLARVLPWGQVDLGFGVGGKVMTDFAGLPDRGLAAAVAPAGKMVVVGSAVVPGRGTDFAVARYLLAAGEQPPRILGARPFYNYSAAGPVDAIDKFFMLPGWNLRFDAVTSYTRGLNGLRVDVWNPFGVELTADDFTFRSAPAKPGSTWVAGPRPASVTMQRGLIGNDRVTIVWDDYNPRAPSPNQAVANGWLEVTVRPERLGLAAPFVFRFGNLIGETGDAPAADVVDLGMRVDARDVVGTVAAQRNYSETFDFNRDGRVNVLDVAAARGNVGRQLAGPLEPAAVASAEPVRKRRGAYLAPLD